METYFLWFLCPTQTLNTISMMVLRALRGEGSKYVSSSFFVCLKAGQKKKKIKRKKTKKPQQILFTNFQWSAALKCSHSLLSFLMEWRWFLSSIFFDLKIRIEIKTVVASAPFFCALVCSVVLGFLHPCAQGWTTCFLLIAKSKPKSSVSVALSLLLISSSGTRKGLVPHARTS